MESLIGNSTNPASYPFPVRFDRIDGANMDTVLKNPSEKVLARMIDVSHNLVKDGVRAITTSCGFNAIFQNELASAVPVPFFSSSLIQIPMIQSMIGKEKSILVLTANKNALHKEHFIASGVTDEMRVEVFGMEESPEWNKIFIAPQEDICLDQIKQEIINTASYAVSNHSADAGAILLECTDLPPFAQAIREVTKLPVFDFITMMGFVARSIGVIKTY